MISLCILPSGFLRYSRAFHATLKYVLCFTGDLLASLIGPLVGIILVCMGFSFVISLAI